MLNISETSCLDWSGDDGGGNRKKRVESKYFQKGKLNKINKKTKKKKGKLKGLGD